MSQITLGELSKTELKKLAEERGVELPSDAKHPAMVEILTAALGSDVIDDGLDETPEDESEATTDESEEESEVVDETPEEVVEEKPKAKRLPKPKPRANGEYIVLANLKRDGEFYPKGSTILIEDEEAAEKLLADGTVE